MVKLFRELVKGDWFHFGDRPERLLMKDDHEHYIAPEGVRHINPNVLVIFKEIVIQARKSIFDQRKD